MTSFELYKAGRLHFLKGPLTTIIVNVVQIKESNHDLPKLKNKPLPKDFKETIKKGFCLKGKNKETPCSGDSGAPAFWYDKKGEPYLGGIMYIGK